MGRIPFLHSVSGYDKGSARAPAVNTEHLRALGAQEPEVTTASTQRTVDLARRLRAAGARFYGAFWCSHCFEQKVAFGAAAAKELPYVECYPDGFHKARALAPPV